MMKNESIKNQYDGPRAPAKKLSNEKISLDYIYSDDAAVIDAGIRDTIKGVRLSILAMGMGLAKIKDECLYTELKFHSMNDYLEKLCDDMQIERPTAHSWLYMGEAYSKYRRDLERIDFTDADGPSKLLYIERALETHEKREAFNNLKKMSFRAFKEFAVPEKAAAKPAKIRVVGNKLFIGKQEVVTFSDELDKKTKDYLADINVKAGEALEAGEILYTTRLYDADELRRFERGANKLKKDMRINYKPKSKK